MGAGRLETKVRIIKASAQPGVPAGKSSFPCQDPLSSCTEAAGHAYPTACSHSGLYPPLTVVAALAASEVESKMGSGNVAASVSFVILISVG